MEGSWMCLFSVGSQEQVALCVPGGLALPGVGARSVLQPLGGTAAPWWSREVVQSAQAGRPS